jgi:hypothetical protein
MIKKLFAFDFDDTLAITPSIIGIRRIDSSGNSDLEFKNYLLDNEIDFNDVDGEKSNNEIFWLDSGMFAKYESIHKKDLEYLKNLGMTDEYDFSKTASVDLDNSQAISPIIDIVKQAYSQPNSKVVIITARSGNSAIPSLSGKSVSPSNRDDIISFLDQQGVSISSGDISTTGDANGSPQDKVNAIQSYIKAYDPEEIYFYDDNNNNVKAVAGLCEELYPHIKITVYKLGKNGSIEYEDGCSESYYRKFLHLMR